MRVIERAVDQILLNYEPVMLFIDKQTFSTIKNVADENSLTVKDFIVEIINERLNKMSTRSKE